MTDTAQDITLTRFSGGVGETVNDIVAREGPATIILNNRELVTALCTPEKLDYLAIGFLSAEGFIRNKSEIKKVQVDGQRGIVRVETTGEDFNDEGSFKRFITSGCGRGASFYSAADATLEKLESNFTVPAKTISALLREFQHRSDSYKSTGGVHSAALAGPEGIRLFAEDIGRHNAIDKLFGQCVLEDIPTADTMVFTSGRLTSEILVKVARRSVPVLVSRSAPTDLTIRLASTVGTTLIGFARGISMNVYTHAFRILSG